MIVPTAFLFLLLGFPLPAACRAVPPPALDQFERPPVTSRIKFRYWFPDASVPVASVQRDIADLASNGAGGLQLVPFYYYGNPSDAPPLTDWRTFGFGTEAFRRLFEAALDAAVENNILMDFALGASQGQGTPAEPGTEGLSLQLQLGVTTINAGTQVTGPVPGPQNLTETLLSGGGFMHGLAGAEKGELKAVIAGRVISVSSGENTATRTVKLDEASIVDLDKFVENGHLNWQVPVDNGTWKIFLLWEGFTNQVSCTGSINGTTTIEKDSLVVDHFSEAGARLHTSFFDNHVLLDSTVNENLRTHSKYAWEDSIEILFALPWTQGFLTRFKGTHGYSLVKYLPLLFGQANSWGEKFAPYPEEYEYGDYYADGLSIHNANFRQTLSECYREYLHGHVQWSKSHGIGFSAQPSYNLPLSLADGIPAVNGPEGESLTFGDGLDAYRSLSGPAQLAGKVDIFFEVGAVSRPAFSQTLPDLLRSIKKSYAGGLTMMVIHGMSYSGPYVQTSWPGYQPFAYAFTDTWSRVQPFWQYIKDTLDYLARTQHILKAGKPRIDLAMYYSSSWWSSKQLYDSDALQKKGRGPLISLGYWADDDQDTLQILLTLRPFETTIIALKPLEGKWPPWVTYYSGQVEAIGYHGDGKLFASLKGPAVVTINGTKTKTLNAAVPSPTELKHWDLEIQDWRSVPNDTTTMEPQIFVHKFTNQSLLPWKDLDAQLEATSGIGIYSAKFTVPDTTGIGAFLSVGPIFHTLRAWINGQQLDPFGADGVKVDITPNPEGGLIPRSVSCK
ncbi:hypothetical protein AFGD_005657 [Aspergillus flavus]|nr:hypothetical protein AFGD_005657 [Aspergillus flavus]